jgi:4-aminobutyrate aminotransferase-like enzyme
VRDRSTKEPLPVKDCEQIFHEALKRGVLLPNATNVLRIVPPLVMSSALAARGLDLMEEAFEAYARTRRPSANKAGS